LLSESSIFRPERLYIAVPYRGAAPAIPDIQAGRIQVYPSVASAVVELHKQGLLRVLAVLDDKRLPMLPDVPTAQEAGVPGLAVVTFNVVSVPTGTPPEIVDVLSKAIRRSPAMNPSSGFNRRWASSRSRTRRRRMRKSL
jgi:tripartite-type tricarboxylate transporter receptor subunit TctC